MNTQILIDDEWVDGDPIIGELYRQKIPVGDSFGYVVQMHLKAQSTAKMVSIGDIINILPLGTKRKLTAMSLIDNEDGDIADLILMFMTIGDPVDANGGKFTKQTNWMMSKTELNITQEHIDEIKAS